MFLTGHDQNSCDRTNDSATQTQSHAIYTFNPINEFIKLHPNVSLSETMCKPASVQSPLLGYADSRINSHVKIMGFIFVYAPYLHNLLKDLHQITLKCSSQ